MKFSDKPVLFTAILLASMMTTSLVFSHGRHDEGAPVVPSAEGQADDMAGMQMMDMKTMHDGMRDTSGMMDKLHDASDMGMEQSQEMLSRRIDILQGLIEQLLKQHSELMESDK